MRTDIFLTVLTVLFCATVIAVSSCTHRHTNNKIIVIKDPLVIPPEDPKTGDTPSPEFRVGARGAIYDDTDVWIGSATDLFGDLLLQATEEDNVLILGPLEIPIPRLVPGDYYVYRMGARVGSVFTVDDRVVIIPLSYLELLGLTAAVLELDGAIAAGLHGRLKVADDRLKVGNTKVRTVGDDR